MVSETYYTALGISESATQAEIKAAYHALLKKIHPDTVSSLSVHVQPSREATEELILAYSVLSDVSKRRDYDEQLVKRRQRLSNALTPPERRVHPYFGPRRYHRCGWPLNAQGRCPKCHGGRLSRRRWHRLLKAWAVILGLTLLAIIIVFLIAYLFSESGNQP